MAHSFLHHFRDLIDDSGIKRKLYYNPSLFPHYHQTKLVETKPVYHFDMPWEDDDDLMVDYVIISVTKLPKIA